MRDDRTRNAGAVNMRPFPAAERIEAVRDRVGKFGMPDVDAGIDHRDGDVGAMGQPVRLRQTKFRERILGGIALGRWRLVLQQIAEVRLHRANAGLGREFTAHDVRRATVDNAEQADRAADKQEILRCDAFEAVPPRQFIGLRVGQRAVDLGHEFVGDRAQVESGQGSVAARTVVLVLDRLAAAPGPTATGRRNRLIPALAGAVAIGVTARRRKPGCGSVYPGNRSVDGDVGIDPRYRIDTGHPRSNVDVGRTHDALRVNRRAIEKRKRQRRCCQHQRRAPHLDPPVGTMLDHEASGLRDIDHVSDRRLTALPPRG